MAVVWSSDRNPAISRKKVVRKTKQLALRKALSERLRAGDVVLVDDLKLGSAKTKEFVGVLVRARTDGTALIVAHRPWTRT